MSHAEIRALCQTEAMKWVDVQRDQFRRLGVLGDWDHPYLTLDPRYEAGILDVLADLLDGGYVFRQLKPIHWCMTDRTALAEAELEYHDETTPSIYVNFPMVSGVPDRLGRRRPDWHAMIWTTTPWTLPANVAIAVHPDLTYAGVRYTDPATGQTVQTILAADLVAKVMALREGHRVRRGRPVPGQGPRARRVSPPVRRPGLARSCWPSTSASRTAPGLVHTAPGHGAEDYQTGRAYQLSVLSPVDASGRFTDEAPEWLVGPAGLRGQSRRSSSELEGVGPPVPRACRSSHSYPHCWRCKKPVIFRATEQWFIAVDHNDLRGRTLKAIDEVRWLPAWGQSRIEAMVSLRPDWCISRQRSWGVPIPALGCTTCQHPAAHRRDGPPLPRPVPHARGPTPGSPGRSRSCCRPGAACPQCGGTSFRKEGDILDVWFESGSSHRAVLDAGLRPGLSRRSCTWKAPTSTAAGSSRRS